MKIFIYSALAATLCAAPAMAQVDVEPRPIAPRPADVAGQIKQDLSELAATLDKPNANFAALPYIYGAREGYFGSNEWAPQFTAWHAGEIRIKDVKILEHKGDNAKATISYTFVTTPNDEVSKAQMGNQQETLDFKLVQLPLVAKKQVWQIVPPEIEPPDVNTENKNVLWANISYHIAQKESYKPKGTPAERSMSNLKQLGLGALQFTQDYDEIYAFDARYVVEALSPYIGDSAIFQVPDTNEIYTFNGNLSGLNMQKTQNDAQTVMFYEGQNETPIFRYDGKAAICFADGHVALVSPDEAKSLIWKP